MKNRKAEGAKDRRERELVAALARGDDRVLERLYAIYRPRLERFLSRLGCHADDMDEACNETLYVVWKRARSFSGKSRVSTWVFGIARNKGMKLIERRQRDRSRQQPEVLDELPDRSMPEEARLELRQWLETGIAMLPPEQRIVIELTFVEGMSCKEISTVMECPENTVKTRMFHARRKLREYLPGERAASKTRNPT